MTILDILSKKKVKPEPFRQDPSVLIPPSKEPQVKKVIVRGSGGKFISKKPSDVKTVESKEKRKVVKMAKPVKPAKKVLKPKVSEVIIVDFYGKNVRKVYSVGKWYFAIDDIVAIATPFNPEKPLKFKKDFEKIISEVSKMFDEVVYSDDKGCLKIIRQIEGQFPGPITRWLTESAQLPFIPPPSPILPQENGPTENERHITSPSDKGM